MPTNDRQTRSNSVTGITLEDIKRLIAESRECLSKDINEVKTILTSFGARVKAVEEAVEKLSKDHTTLKKEVHTFVEDTQYLQSEVTEFCLAEFENRANRMNNIILQGVEETEIGTIEERNRHDENKIQEVIQELGVSDAVFGNFRRIGRKPRVGPRLLKVRLNDHQKKTEILAKSRHLRNSQSFSKVFLRPDRTSMQQEYDYMLKAELQGRRQNGEDVVLYRGRVVDRNDPRNFRRSVL